MTQEELRLAEPGFQTGTICTDSNLYSADDDAFRILEYVAAGQPWRERYAASVPIRIG